MAQVSSHPAGTPSWVDLGSPDLEASKDFYGGLFGWEAEAVPDADAGGYTEFKLRGRAVAGLGPLMSEAQPPAWMTYVSVVDTDKTASTATQHGGSVVMEPLDVFDAGRMAILADPAGAVFALWQPRTHPGATLVNEHGSLCWNELVTRDVEGATSFYRAVFGWEAADAGVAGVAYSLWNLDGRGIGGMMAMGDDVPAEVPPHWMVSFAVDDCDASLARVTELGGAVTVAATEIETVGRFAVASGPHGEQFGVIAVAGEPPAPPGASA